MTNPQTIRHAAMLANLDFEGEEERVTAFLEILQLIEDNQPITSSETVVTIATPKQQIKNLQDLLGERDRTISRVRFLATAWERDNGGTLQAYAKKLREALDPTPERTTTL